MTAYTSGPEHSWCLGLMRQHFALKRHLLRAALYRKQLVARFVAWCEVTGLAQNPPYLWLWALPATRPEGIQLHGMRAIADSDEAR
jgi:hypothetical protein